MTNETGQRRVGHDGVWAGKTWLTREIDEDTAGRMGQRRQRHHIPWFHPIIKDRVDMTPQGPDVAITIPIGALQITATRKTQESWEIARGAQPTYAAMEHDRVSS